MPAANENLDRLMKGKHPEVADAMEKRSGRIVDAWSQMVRRDLPDAERLTVRQLQDDVPLLIGWLATALRSGAAKPLRELLARAPNHGQTRFHQEFNLHELMIEYNMLREMILRQVQEELARPLDPEENIALNLGIDIAIRQSAVEFADHQANRLKAEAESQAKYLSFLSHDLRGGLNGVLLMIEVLRRDLESSGEYMQSLEDLDMMKRTILETVGMMERFLHSERLRRGLFVLKPSRFDLKQFVATISQPHLYVAREKGVKLVQDVPAGTNVIADREVLAMVVGNLISNAVKYSEKGTVRVGYKDGRISVSDEGPGIAGDKMEELFAPFVRGETHGQKGVGLGLSIARQGAEMLGAKLWAESEVGKGTTFYVELPQAGK